jgi:hypothetical protein
LDRFIFEKWHYIEEICFPNYLYPLISKDSIQISGTQAQIDATLPLVNNFVLQIRNSLSTETIINEDECHILKEMMIKSNFLSTYNVIIKKIGRRSITTLNDSDNQEEEKIHA